MYVLQHLYIRCFQKTLMSLQDGIGCNSGSSKEPAQSVNLFEKPMVIQLAKKFPAFYGNRKDINLFSVTLTTLRPSCAVVMNSGNLNSLEPFGPLQACNGTAKALCVVHRSLMLHPVVSYFDPTQNLERCFINTKQKIKQSLYRPEQALRFPGG